MPDFNGVFSLFAAVTFTSVLLFEWRLLLNLF